MGSRDAIFEDTLPKWIMVLFEILTFIYIYYGQTTKSNLDVRVSQKRNQH